MKRIKHITFKHRKHETYTIEREKQGICKRDNISPQEQKTAHGHE